MAKVTLDLETFKALASETRLSVLHALVERRKTVTELARDMDLNKATVHEHLQTLVAAGLVKRKDEGRKWVYYELTWAGDRLLNPVETTTFAVLLGLSIAAAGGGVGMLGQALGWWWQDQKNRGFANEDDLAGQREASDMALAPEGDAADGMMAYDDGADATAGDDASTAAADGEAQDSSGSPPPEGGQDPGGDDGGGEGGSDGGNNGGSDPQGTQDEGDPDAAGSDSADQAHMEGGNATASSPSDGGMTGGDSAGDAGGDAGALGAESSGDRLAAGDDAADSAGAGFAFDDGGLLAIALLVASVVLLALAFALRRGRGGRRGPGGSPPDS
ncbi:MAG: winged helix-turn-helix domain-containing protein [Thermoplasmatota archaeon]